jgi:hypothetical protein
MRKSAKQFLSIARVCAVLAKNSADPQEREKFSALAVKWQKYAIGAEADASELTEASAPENSVAPGA